MGNINNKAEDTLSNQRQPKVRRGTEFSLST